MADISVLETLIEGRATARTLKRGSSAASSIKVLQEVLHHLGFGRDLEWERYGPDGDYGKGTAKAVQRFARRNGIDSDGSRVTADLGRLLVRRYRFLDEMQHMQEAVEDPSILARLRYRADVPVAITVLQDILHEHGFDEEMEWEKYGADGEYGAGTTAAVKAFGARHGIETDGRGVTAEMAEKSLEAFRGFYGPDWFADSPEVLRESLRVAETDRWATVSDDDDSKRFRRFKLGYYSYGDVKTAAFIDANRPELKRQGMTDSALNVMLGVSDNEGNIDAVNTWDNAHLTFGMFQWTIGVGTDQGELPALLKKIKDRDPTVFEACYGRHGLDVASGTTDTHGRLVLDGRLISKRRDKAAFRTPKWCFVFWKAGQHPLVQAASVEHAFSRIGTFVRSPAYKVFGHHVADIVTSEYGMALVLDNHVNRPGYVAKCLEKAVAATGLKGTDPGRWKTPAERELLERYVEIRETYGSSPMTHAAGRAEVTRSYLTKGTISDERGSFRY